MAKKRKKETDKRKKPEKELYIIISLLVVVFSIFAYTAFVKIPALWGINYLYYLPAWKKYYFLP